MAPAPDRDTGPPPTGEPTEGAPDSAPASAWSRARQDLAIVLWPSFLAGAAATMFFFAVFDPVALGEGTVLAGLLASHNAGYALGFFFFWLVAAVSSALSIYLARTQHTQRTRDVAPWLRDKP
ncbi:MAG TPA: hypothetical protein VN790_04275 [Steroidobacteraceae bacterium]|nr:hypothetical protein [Steroidobacteraceae bacterium]